MKKFLLFGVNIKLYIPSLMDKINPLVPKTYFLLSFCILLILEKSTNYFLLYLQHIKIRFDKKKKNFFSSSFKTNQNPNNFFNPEKILGARGLTFTTWVL